MVPNRIMRGGAVRRAPLLLVACALAAAVLAGCGGGGDGGSDPVVDKAADAVTLNVVLSRQLAAVRAYERTLPLLRGAARRSAEEFRAQEQEHVDSILKALRGLGEKSEPKEEEIESEGLKTQADALTFLYEVESVSVANDLRALSHLTAPWPRVLMASIAANQAQHLVVLREQLGADVAESIPEAFEDGTIPAPSEETGE
jgi:rubrerythrin